MYLAGNKDILEVLLFLKIAKRFLQRKSKFLICKVKVRQNRTESVKNRTTSSNWSVRDTSATQIKKTQNWRTKDNYIENAVEKIQTKKMIWWFYTNFSIQGQNLFPRQHLTTFELSSNQRLHLAQNWKAKIQWWCYSSKQHQDTTKAK